MLEYGTKSAILSNMVGRGTGPCVHSHARAADGRGIRQMGCNTWEPGRYLSQPPQEVTCAPEGMLHREGIMKARIPEGLTNDPKETGLSERPSLSD